MLFKDQKQLSEFVENVRKLRRVYSGKVNVTDDSSASWESRLLCSMDGDGEKDEEVDLLEPPCTATTVGSDDEKTDNQTSAKTKFSFKNPFSKKKKPEDTPAEEEGEEIPIEKRPGFLHAIKLPLVSVLPRKLKSTKEPDLEEGGGSTTPKPAGLASMETLDDSNGSTKHSDDKTDEGLETVKLDSSVEEKAALDTEKNSDEKKVWDRNALMDRLASLKEFRYIIAGVVVFLILLIIIVVIAIAGPRPITASPIINGRYVRAVTSCGEVEGLFSTKKRVKNYLRNKIGPYSLSTTEKYQLSGPPNFFPGYVLDFPIESYCVAGRIRTENTISRFICPLKLQPSNEVTVSLIFRGLDKAGEFPQEDLIGCFRRFVER
ncbi:hypothetical protein J6590_058929 [Homalodisca vitripennis]|nr:hypothetical protein J6590_058929 [Homalodisca vitripennis]